MENTENPVSPFPFEAKLEVSFSLMNETKILWFLKGLLDHIVFTLHQTTKFWPDINWKHLHTTWMAETVEFVSGRAENMG